MARAERPHLPSFPGIHMRPRDFILATVALSGLAVGGGIAADQSGVFANGSTSGDDEGRNRIVAPLLTAEPTFTLTPFPTETPVPTFTPTAEPTEVPTKAPVVVVPPTQKPVQPTAVPTKEAPKIVEGFNPQMSAEVNDAINALRASNGLNVLRVDSRLMTASQNKVQVLLNVGFPDNINYDPHSVGGGSTAGANSVGYPARYVAEVIYVGQLIRDNSTGVGVVARLSTSPSHLTAMLNKDLKDVGASCWQGYRSYRPYVPQGTTLVVICVASPAY